MLAVEANASGAGWCHLWTIVLAMEASYIAINAGGGTLEARARCVNVCKLAGLCGWCMLGLVLNAAASRECNFKP